MEKDRLTAFSDGVIAVIITIMVLNLQIPHTTDWSSLQEVIPGFLSYVLSFIYIAIYWNNHHHLLQTVHRVNGTLLWANMHLLFWLSLVPWATAWAQAGHIATAPTAFFGIVLFLSAMAYFILQKIIICSQGHESILQKALGSDIKGKASLLLYAIAVLLAFKTPDLSYWIYALVAALWLVPDQRIERTITGQTLH
ncbi:MAG: TMEM175 family protein [Alphaproteobacteria bacterium]